MIVEAALWSFFASSTVLVGTWIALKFKPSPRTVGLIMGFGAGALIAAVAYTLFPSTMSRDFRSFIALALGGIVFFLGAAWIENRGKGKGVKKRRLRVGEEIVLGALLDGIPESLVLGMTFVIGGPAMIAFFGAELIANLPQGIASSADMKRGGISPRRIYALWLFVIAICVLSTVLGVILIQANPELTGVYAMAAAGGAVLSMLAVTMVPQGFADGGRLTGLMVVLGFAVAAMIGVVH